MKLLKIDGPKSMVVHFGEEIGRGGFAVVFKGENTEGEFNGSSCAIKMTTCMCQQRTSGEC